MHQLGLIWSGNERCNDNEGEIEARCGYAGVVRRDMEIKKQPHLALMESMKNGNSSIENKVFGNDSMLLLLLWMCS